MPIPRGRAAGLGRRRTVVPAASASQQHAAAPAHNLDHACQKDRIVVLTRDSYWLHAYWELSRTTLARAQAALGQDWHTARPILRVMDVSSEDTTSSTERQVRDIPIHGGVNNWYIDVLEPPRSYRIDIGYLSRRGRFYVLARSNVVTTPKAGVTDPLDRELDRRPEAVRPDRDPCDDRRQHQWKSSREHRDRPSRPVRRAPAPPHVQSRDAEPHRGMPWHRWGATSISRSMPS